MNGANMSKTEPYAPQTSSYDYDAPLDEAGNPAPKFFKFRAVIEKHLPPGQKLPTVPAKTPAIAIRPIKFSQKASLFNNARQPVTNNVPLCFEDLNQGYGFVLYRTTLKNATNGLLKISEMRDYASVYLNGQRVGILDRRLKQDSLQISSPDANATLDILVENNGRINYGPFLIDNRQGITEKVTLAGAELTGWKMYKFPFTSVTGFTFTANKPQKDIEPTLFKGTFTLTKTGDTYLDMRGFGKGFVFLNGHNLGKYWYIGPQQTIYVPACWLKKGINQITVFDELKSNHASITTLDHPLLNEVVKD